MLDEPGVFEHAQVAGDCRAADREPRRELTNGQGRDPQSLQDLAASRASEGVERMHKW